METEGPQTEQGNAGHDNVVRLPRDWIGPREELIPFGPAADRQAAEDDSAPPSAADFWGEESAAIQDAVQAPIAPADLGPSPLAHPGRGAREGVPGSVGASAATDSLPATDRSHGRSIGPRLRARRISYGRPPAAESRFRGTAGVRWSRRAAVVALLSVAAVSAIGAWALANRSSHAQPTTSAPSTALLAVTRTLDRVSGVVNGAARAHVKAIKPHISGRRRVASTRHVSHQRPARVGAARSNVNVSGSAAAVVAASPSIQRVTSTSSSSSGLGSGGAGVGASGAGSGGSEGGSSGGGGGGSGGGSSGGANAGPTGPGAAFGPGTLN